MATLVIHGGAGDIAPEDRTNYNAGLQAALSAGYDALLQGTALEAVLAAITLMENNTLAFNAGTGGSPNRESVVECDAAVMLSDGTAGAVAAMTNAQNPILIANKVRTSTPHAFVVGAGANRLVDNPIDNDKLLTERTRQHIADWLERKGEPSNSATVGAVALDDNGNLAAATSTGGVLGKWQGRVGDAPLIGAGTYATEQVAISCTGKGEAFLRAVTAKDIANRLEYGVTLEAAIKKALADVVTFDGTGGLIVVTKEGQIGYGFNTAQMAYGYKNNNLEASGVALEAGIVVLG